MIVAVCGGKGGTGKSTVAWNLGAAMNGVVVDCDLVMANLPEGHGANLHDVLAGRAEPGTALEHRAGMKWLPSGRSLAGAVSADPARLPAVIREVAAGPQDVVLDCPAGLDAGVGLPLWVADRVVAVTTPTRSAVADALRTRGAAIALNAGLSAVALNRADGTQPIRRIERVFGAPAVAIPETEELAGELTAARPRVLATPDSDVSDRLQQLADHVRT